MIVQRYILLASVLGKDLQLNPLDSIAYMAARREC